MNVSEYNRVNAVIGTRTVRCVNLIVRTNTSEQSDWYMAVVQLIARIGACSYENRLSSTVLSFTI